MNALTDCEFSSFAFCWRDSKIKRISLKIKKVPFFDKNKLLFAKSSIETVFN